MKNKFGFILVKPQLGENIGACARSLKNFGFSNLLIVSPKQSWPNNRAKATSVGAYDIVKKAKVYNDINWEWVSENVNRPFWIFDTRSILQDKNIKNLGLNIWQLGNSNKK